MQMAQGSGSAVAWADGSSEPRCQAPAGVELEAENRALRKKLEGKDEVIDVLKKSVGILSKP